MTEHVGSSKSNKDSSGVVKHKYRVDLPHDNYMGRSIAEIMSKSLFEMVVNAVMAGNPYETNFEALLQYKYRTDNKTTTQAIFDNLI